MNIGIRQQLEELITLFEANGIKCTYDPVYIHPPCAWIGAKKIQGYSLDGQAHLEFEIYLISPETDIPIALSTLETMLGQALDLVGGYVIDSDLGTSVTLPSGGVAPAMRLTIAIPQFTK